MNMKQEIVINDRKIGEHYPVYFIADIAANHDGDIERAKKLIYLAAEAGANAAKFQHFKASTIISDKGFNSLPNLQSHQSSWGKSVFDVYQDATVKLEWTAMLKETCDDAGIAFFTSPYAFDLVEHIDPYVPAYKIGSGDITWLEMIEHIAGKQKPYILASGASNFDDVQRAVSAGLNINSQMCLMQCNTNYSASLDNFKYIKLNVLKVFREMYPKLILGLSDHTSGHATVLGAVSLGAKMIEKHFTDDVNREGPDHKFSMDFGAWKEMVDRTRELENALGDGIKKVEDNEVETVILQRRAIRLKKGLKSGTIITKNDLDVLRPCPHDGLPPYEIERIIGRELKNTLMKGEHIKWADLV